MSRTTWRFLRRKERRLEAIERQEYYDSLSTKAKIAWAESRRGESKKELARLREPIEAEAA